MSAKRRRISSRCRQGETACKDTRCTLDALPPEILDIILRRLPLHDVAYTVRLVSRHCSNIATTVLNSEFLVAGTRLEVAVKRMEMVTNRVESESEFPGLYSALKIIWSLYRMLKAVTWRYTHPRSRNSPISCFYGGKILDNLNCLLEMILEYPRERSRFFTHNDLRKFARSCEDFMDHFEKVTERRLNRSALMSGCKIVDLLDCLAKGRKVLSFRSSPRTNYSMVTMQLQYVLKRTWFMCLSVSNTSGENCWTDRQRYMYLRLRRLVSIVNGHRLHKMQYDLFVQRTSPSVSLLRSPTFTYSGYGEYGGQFFYYGNMSKHACDNRFKYMGNARNSEGREEEANNPSRCTLIILVELRCSPELAPLAAKTNLKYDDLEICDIASRQELYLKLSIKCATSEANRLPKDFTWEVRSP